MVMLRHEIWEEDGQTGALPGLCLAGPDGEAFRRSLPPDARLVHTFEAESNFEAMMIYYGFNGWGEYKLNVPEDRKPYPDAWADRQNVSV
jgi:hypothetical protein